MKCDITFLWYEKLLVFLSAPRKYFLVGEWSLRIANKINKPGRKYCTHLFPLCVFLSANISLCISGSQTMRPAVVMPGETRCSQKIACQVVPLFLSLAPLAVINFVAMYNRPFSCVRTHSFIRTLVEVMSCRYSMLNHSA